MEQLYSLNLPIHIKNFNERRKTTVKKTILSH